MISAFIMLSIAFGIFVRISVGVWVFIRNLFQLVVIPRFFLSSFVYVVSICVFALTVIMQSAFSGVLCAISRAVILRLMRAFDFVTLDVSLIVRIHRAGILTLESSWNPSPIDRWKLQKPIKNPRVNFYVKKQERVKKPIKRRRY